jgi:hypothetical protein
MMNFFAFRMNRLISSSCIALLSLTACTSTSTTTGTGTRISKTSSAMQEAIGGCIVTVAGGAILGKILGNDDRSAIVGAALGGVACIALLEVANQKDRARIAAEEAAAVRANRTRTQTIRTQSGKTATVRSVVRTAPTPPRPKPAPVRAAPDFRSAPAATTANVTACRTVQQTVTVGDSSSTAPSQVWCRVEGGDWQPWG